MRKETLCTVSLCILALVVGFMAPSAYADVRNPVNAAIVSTPPVQDGVIGAGEYGDAVPVNIASSNAFQVDWGSSNLSVDPSDCNFDIYCAWDATALYVALDVTDNVVLIDPDAPGKFFAACETIQIVLANMSGTLREAGSLSDIEMLPAGGINWVNNAGGGDVDWDGAAITGNYGLTAKGYVLEMRYPWADFNFPLPTIQPGAQIKALFAVVDKDVADAFEVFMLSSGGPAANPFENHADLSPITLVGDDNDMDGLKNDEEATLGTDPNNPDTDGDGLTDGAEVNTYGTDPLSADTDGDGASDKTEITFGTDPLDAGDVPVLPAAQYGGLAALAVLLAGAATVVVIRRKRTA